MWLHSVSHDFIWFDGGSRGNPGPAGAGAVKFSPADHGGAVLWAGHVFVGINATNNLAEYAGLELGLAAVESVRGVRRLVVPSCPYPHGTVPT